MATRIEALTGDASVDQLRNRLAELSGPPTRYRGPVRNRPRRGAAELDAATVVVAQAIAECDKHRKVAEAAAKQLGERETRVALVRDKLATEQGQIALARDELTRQRAVTTDAELAVKAEAHAGRGASREPSRR